jgi:DNA polymerase III epsilon subunit-like protein
MKHLVFDTETTALIINSARALAHQPYIFEIACILWNDTDDSEATHHWQIDPGAPISKDATKKTGITDAMVRGRPLFHSIAPQVRGVIEQADCIVAHNYSFDKAMIDLEFRRVGEIVRWPARHVCTIESTEHLQGYRLKLELLYEILFHEHFEKAHSAVADTKATLRCCRELLNGDRMMSMRSDRRFATTADWALASDGHQWILMRRRIEQGKQAWRPVSFVRSTKEILERSLREKGADVATSRKLLEGLPATFDEWKTRQTRSPGQAGRA